MITIRPASRFEYEYCTEAATQRFDKFPTLRFAVGELAAGVKAEGLVFGLYHSLFEW